MAADKGVRKRWECHKAAGSFTVFFAMIFVSLAAFYFVLICAANHCMTITWGRSITDSAAHSVLAEYDREIEKKYGLYAVGSSAEASAAFAFYLTVNTEGETGPAVFPARVNRAELQTESSLAQPSVVSEQIQAFMKARILPAAYDEIMQTLGLVETQTQQITEAVRNWQSGETEQEKMNQAYVWGEKEEVKVDIRKLWAEIDSAEKNDWLDLAENKDKLTKGDPIYRNLPSAFPANDEDEEEETGSLLESLLGWIKKEAWKSVEKLALVEYAGGMLCGFSDTVVREDGRAFLNLRMEPKQCGFFENELEYLLKGSFNEYKNVKAARRRILAIRTIFNMAAIKKDSEKEELLQAFAECIEAATESPVIGKAAYAAMWVGWGLWEAYTDWEDLAGGQRVSLIKGKEEWNTSLEGLFADNGEKRIQKSGEKKKGFSYLQYVKLLLCFKSNETLLRRIQDLIYLEKEGAMPLKEYLTEFSTRGSLRSGGREYAFGGSYRY